MYRSVSFLGSSLFQALDPLSRRRKQVASSNTSGQATYLTYGLVIVASVFVVLAIARYYPAPTESSSGIASNTDRPPVALPEVAAEISPEAMREQTQEVIANLIARYPNEVAPLRIAAEYAQSTYRYEDARSHWLAAAKIEPGSHDAQVGLARVDLAEGKPEEAVAKLNPIYQPETPNRELSTQLARGLQQMGELDQAAQVAHQGLQAFPTNIPLLEAAAEIDSQRGELQSAVQLCQHGLQVNPTNGSLHLILSNVYRRLGEIEQADQHLETSRKYRNQVKTGEGEFERKYDRSVRDLVSQTIARAADFFADRDDPGQAEKLALQAAELYPQGADAYRVLSKVCYQENRFEDAYLVHRRLVEVEPDNPLNYVSLSKLAFLSGDAATGREALMTARQRMPGSSIVATALAACYLEEGNLAKAREMAKQSIQIEPSVQAYQVLSTACAGLRDQDGQRTAELAIRNLMKSAPSNN